MDTDILGGAQLGFKTVLVLSGGTRREDLTRFAYRPDMVVESIADLHHAELADIFAPARDGARRPRPNGARAPALL